VWEKFFRIGGVRDIHRSHASPNAAGAIVCQAVVGEAALVPDVVSHIGDGKPDWMGAVGDIVKSEKVIGRPGLSRDLWCRPGVCASR